jgi:error-prone DNA polymerase
MPSRDDFVSLLCRSGYTFHQAASLPEEYMEDAARRGQDCLGIADRDGVYGAVRAHVAGREFGVRPLVGAEISRIDGPPLHLLAMDLQGYGDLCELISLGRGRADKGESRIRTVDLLPRAGRLILVHRHLESEPAARALREAFGDRLYAGLSRYVVAADAPRIIAALEQARALGALPVVAHPIRFHHPARKPLADVMAAIRSGTTLEEAGHRLPPNSWLRALDPEERQHLYGEWPDALRRTRAVAERCSFSLDELRYHYPAEGVPEGYEPDSWLRHLVREGARRRYPEGVPDDVKRQLRHELNLIAELTYANYFITMHDIVARARAQGILCQGRGSAANSAVCYVLAITSIDPVRSRLLFERFISKERGEPPDIDVDFEHERREEVIQDIYARYGRSRAAMVANFIRYRRRMAVRDVGKTLGFSLEQVDRISGVMHQLRREDASFEEVSHASGLDPTHRRVRLLGELVRQITGFPRHLSIHVGGFVISDLPVHRMVPVEPARKEGRTVIQWDKEDVEDAGLLKIDILSLGMLTAIRKSFELLHEHRGVDLTLASIPPDDRRTFTMIQRADTVGVFQIESRAQMNMLGRLKPACYYDLVVQVAIVRPGPIQGGMVHPYLRRRRGQEPVTYPIPALEPVLERTYGVPLFQEQVMKLAMVAGDFTAGEADRLRRAMGPWRASKGLNPILERLMERMETKGISRTYARQIADQIRGFGEYGFPESHAASFALLAYASSYLKCHYPEVFAAALVNSQPMGFYRPHTILHDAARHGVDVRPLDVNRSRWDCTLEAPMLGGEGPRALRLGLRLVKGLRSELAVRLVAVRDAGGGFRDMEGLVARTGCPAHVLLKLAVAGALDGLIRDEGGDVRQRRVQAIWSAHRFYGDERGILARTPAETRLPAFPGMGRADRLVTEHHHAGTAMDTHPMDLIRPWLKEHRYLDSKTVKQTPSGRRIRTAGLVIVRQRPPTAGGMLFVTLEDEKGFVDLVVPPTVRARFRTPLLTHPILAAEGTLERDGNSSALKVTAVHPLYLADEPIRNASRDFR